MMSASARCTCSASNEVSRPLILREVRRFSANPEWEDRAASRRPPSILAGGSALGSCRHVALTSARLNVILLIATRLNKMPALYDPAFFSRTRLFGRRFDPEASFASRRSLIFRDRSEIDEFSRIFQTRIFPRIFQTPKF